MKKNVLLIGLGRFGRHLAMQVNQMGHQVMGVDRNEERVNECMDFLDVYKRQRRCSTGSVRTNWYPGGNLLLPG